MSSSNGSAMSNGRHHRFGKGSCCSKGNWSGLNIATMVIGFIIFWPLGLVVLYWNITGRNLKDLPDAARDLWAKYFNNGAQSDYRVEGENVVFDEYQQTQHDRIKEIKEEIGRRARRFKDYRSNTKRNADEEEFKDFMSKKPDS